LDLELGRTDLILRIPNDLDRDLIEFGSAQIQLIIDAEDGAAAGVISAYVSEIVARFNRRTGRELISQIGLDQRPSGSIEIRSAYWYNRELDYDTFMVPGILVLLVTIIGLLLSSMNLVREKETGTIEQLNVTPIRKYELITGKLAPFWILALLELAIGLLVAKLVFETPTEGSLWLMFAAAAIYLLVVLGIGLFISTVTNTQQQAMFITWFIMVIFILMGGLFTPIESMPVWAQHLTIANPVAHFIEIMRRIMLKGAGIGGVWPLLVVLAVFGAGVLALATRTYSKVSA
jgi:ABC-2 type transport system permease protein